MRDFLVGSFSKGWDFVKGNPQIVWTGIIALSIVVSFVVVSNLFLEVAVRVQNRFELFRLSTMQDALVPLVRTNLHNPIFLATVLGEIKNYNPSIEEFRVLQHAPEGARVVVASLDETELGQSDPVSEEGFYHIADPQASTGFQIMRGSGRYFISIRPVFKDGQIIAWVYTGTLVTPFDQEIESQRRVAYAALFFVIAGILVLLVRHARILDYSSLYKRLKEVDQLKDDFISMASHELRTPMTVIRGYIDVMKGFKSLAEIPEEERNKILEIMNRIDFSARELDALVSDILDVARIEQGRIKFEFTDLSLGSLVKEVADGLRPVAEKKNLALSYEIKDSGIVHIDPTRTRQILTNLIGNAVKYTLRGEVKIETYTKEGKTYARVSDTGIGLTADEQKKLFAKFYRAESSDTKEISGTGLGLWISREMARKMGGDIAVESIKGVGSHFTLLFPEVSRT